MSDIDRDREENVQMRAYLLWEMEGKQEGKADEYWFRALERIQADSVGIPSDTVSSASHLKRGCPDLRRGDPATSCSRRHSSRRPAAR